MMVLSKLVIISLKLMEPIIAQHKLMELGKLLTPKISL